MINSELNFTLEEILPKFHKEFQEKIKHSVELLRKAEKLALAYSPNEGFYLSFSSGKDSQCLYHIAKIAGVKFKTHMGAYVRRSTRSNQVLPQALSGRRYDKAENQHL